MSVFHFFTDVVILVPIALFASLSRAEAPPAKRSEKGDGDENATQYQFLSKLTFHSFLPWTDFKLIVRGNFTVS